MRTLLTLMSLAALAAPVSGQASDGVRASLRVPAMMEVTAAEVGETVTAAAGSQLYEREVLLRVRSNVPWRLSIGFAADPSNGAGAAGPVSLEVEPRSSAGDMAPARLELAPGVAGVEAVRSVVSRQAVVAVRVRWRGNGARAGSESPPPPGLIYSLSELD